jgi:hypothetical protein
MIIYLLTFSSLHSSLYFKCFTNFRLLKIGHQWQRIFPDLYSQNFARNCYDHNSSAGALSREGTGHFKLSFGN